MASRKIVSSSLSSLVKVAGCKNASSSLRSWTTAKTASWLLGERGTRSCEEYCFKLAIISVFDSSLAFEATELEGQWLVVTKNKTSKLDIGTYLDL